MSRSVIFQGGGTGLKIAAGGQDAASAGVFDLLFNSDIKPLRLWGTGYVAVPSLTNFNWSPAWAVSAGPVVQTPPGTYPLFMIAGKQSAPSGSVRALKTPFHTSGYDGYGAFISPSKEFWGLNFVHDAGSVRYMDAIINFAILKNYG
ncbi:hypothetical protein [Rhodopseudomonas sp.]|uniref:hypothetical protein n=1 Tax=Rhodopseudomonas sp. TaxID=1078 RepID=UPI003B3ADC7A